MISLTCSLENLRVVYLRGIRGKGTGEKRDQRETIKLTFVFHFFRYRFDLKNSNLNDANLETVKAERLPDVVLVKKVYGDKSERDRKRRWRLRRLALETASVANEDMNEFMEDLEEDADLRKHVNVYKKKNVALDEESSVGDDEAPKIDLAEMLDDMDLAE